MTSWSEITCNLVAAAIAEDLGQAGDITSALLPDPAAQASATLVMRQPGVLCGLTLVPLILAEFTKRLNQPLTLAPLKSQGVAISDGFVASAVTPVATIAGPRAAILTAERTLLNFLGRMSGVATLTRAYVSAAKAANPNVAVLDTRKTLPAWRELDRYAVRTGGGTNHRWGLNDAVLFKDNHLAGIPVDRLAEELKAMLARLTRKPAFVEVEVDSLAQFEEVCRVPGIDMILLDNFAIPQLREAVARRDRLADGRRIQLEASGGVTLQTIGAIAATGVNCISVGSLTHSAVSVDLALDT